MKALLSSDWHIDASTAGVERFDELAAYVDTIATAATAEGVDVVCFGGDAFDPGSLHESKWSAFMVRAAAKLASAAKYGAVLIPGNHDVLDVSEPCSVLSPLAAAVESFDVNGVVLAELPRWIEIHGSDGGVLALPYVSRAVERTEVYRSTLAKAMGEAREARERGAKVLALGHYTIPGIDPGSEGEMVRGRDLLFPSAMLREVRPTLITNGHYHAQQTHTVDGLRVEIIGAPVRFTFGERDDGPRGFLLAEV
jgi:DNA repair exonuclease SbcCD nuclease subunit